MFNFQTCESNQYQSTESLRAQVELILPLSKSARYHAEEMEAQERLVQVAEQYGIQWLPVPTEGLLLVRKRSNRRELKRVQLPPALADWWLSQEKEPWVFVGKLDYAEGQPVILPAQGSLLGTSKEGDFELEPWDSIAQLERFEADPSTSPEDQGAFVEKLLEFEADGVFVDEAGSWWMAWLFRQLSKLPPAVMAEVTCLMRPGLKIMTHGEDVGITIKKKMLEYQFWFGSRTILSNTGTETRLMERCSINGEGYLALPLFMILGVLLGGRYQGSIPAFLNELPNAWQRDEGSYGLKPETDHTTGVVNSDLRLPLAGRYRDWDRGNLCLSRFPWVVPLNGKFTPTLLAQTIESEGASAPDKYNMKSATGRLGCMALGMAMSKDKGMVWTIHDASKPNKWLNRPTQARLFNFLKATICRPNGEEERRRGLMENTVES